MFLSSLNLVFPPFSKEHAAAVLHLCTPEIELKKLDKTRTETDFVICHFCMKSCSVLSAINCPLCKNRFCLQHRHKVDHNCIINETTNENVTEANERKKFIEEAMAKIRSTMGSGIIVKNHGSKNAALALRVAKMKLKSTAVGQESILETERLYFYFTFVPNKYSYEQDSKAFENKPVFISDQWSIGKTIDWLAGHFSLTNKNNEPEKPKLLLTNENLVKQSPQSNSWCCDKHNKYLCFSHQLKELIEKKVVNDTDLLLLVYLQI